MPRPTGHEPASYGALLGVRRLDPREPWQRTDTFHLAAPDLDLVHVLRSAGFVSAGTLAHVLPRLVRTAIVDNAQSRRLGRNLEVLRAFGAAWRVGRPRPATVADIDRSGAVSETFRPRALELLEEARGNAARFLAAAPGGIPRFQARKLEALREHLTEAGCVDDRDPLDDEEIVSSVLLRVASAPDAEARTPVDEVRARVHYLLRAIPQEIVDDPSSRSSGSDPTG